MLLSSFTYHQGCYLCYIPPTKGKFLIPLKFILLIFNNLLNMLKSNHKID